MSETCTVCASRNDVSPLGKARATVDCKTAVFFANASDGPYSNERLEQVKKRRHTPCERVRLTRFTLEDHTYGASRLPKTTVLQSSANGTMPYFAEKQKFGFLKKKHTAFDLESSSVLIFPVRNT